MEDKEKNLFPHHATNTIEYRIGSNYFMSTIVHKIWKDSVALKC